MFPDDLLYTCSCCTSVLACCGQRNSSGMVLCRRFWVSLEDGLPGVPSEPLNRTSLTISAGDLNTTGRSGCDVRTWGGLRLLGGLYSLLFGKRTLGSTLEKSGKAWFSCPFLKKKQKNKQTHITIISSNWYISDSKNYTANCVKIWVKEKYTKIILNAKHFCN